MPRRTVLALAAVLAAASAAALAAPAPAGAATTSAVTGRVSVSSAGLGAHSHVGPVVATDETGRFVLFDGAGTYAGRDTNGAPDVYLRDRLAGSTTRVSVTDGEAQIAGTSRLCGASADLRFVGFWSDGTNLPAGGTGQVYVRDRALGTTALASTSSGGASALPNGSSGIYPDQRCDVSADGRYVAFTSHAPNLVAGDTNGWGDVFRRDRATATTVRVSVKSNGVQLEGGDSYDPSMSDDGNRIVFTSLAPAIVGDENGKADIYRKTMSTGLTSLISIRTGIFGNDHSTAPAISGDGDVIAFSSLADNLVPGGDDDNGVADVFVHEDGQPAPTLGSVTSTEAQAEGGPSTAPALSADGRYLTFASGATNLWLFDDNGVPDIFLRDRTLGLTYLVSRKAVGLHPPAGSSPGRSAVSAGGTAVAFLTTTGGFGSPDGEGQLDVYVRDTAVDHAPFASFDEHAAQQVQDLTGAPATPAQVAALRARLVNGEVSPDRLITELAHAPAWAGRRAPVTRLYWAFFLRPPDAAGLAHWTAQLAAGRTLQWVAGHFAGSAEFKAKYGSLGHGGFVSAIYQNIFEREPDAAGLAFWTNELQTGHRTRGQVMVGFSESAEGRARLAPQVGIVLTRLGMLGAIPPKAPFALLLDAMEAGVPLEELVRNVRTSEAYAARFD